MEKNVELVKFKCSFCSYIVSMEEKHLGLKVNCPSCKNSVISPIKKFTETCVIGDFVLDRKLGEGSLGAVYKATQISLDRTVALKVLFPEYSDAKGVKTFLKEARTAAKLTHPNLIQALAAGHEGKTCYMAMTYIKGRTLISRIEKNGALGIDESLHIVQQVAEALFYAWDEGEIIHRDIKPENIMITDDDIVKVADLGLAINKSDWTEDMEVSGSPSYMSTEQFAGEELDSRSDIYSLGISLYQMLTGKLPYNGDSIEEMAQMHFHDKPISILKYNPLIPAKLWSLVQKMIAKHPDDRFSNMEELLNEIWSLRQKTAPDKDLVPAVHTISMNNLSYSVQEKMKEERSKKQKSILEDKKNKANKSKILLLSSVCIGLVILGLLFSQSQFMQPTDECLAIESKINRLEVILNNGELNINDIKDKINSLLKEILKYDTSDKREGLINRLKLLDSNTDLIILKKLLYNNELDKLDKLQSIDNIKARNKAISIIKEIGNSKRFPIIKMKLQKYIK